MKSTAVSFRLATLSGMFALLLGTVARAQLPAPPSIGNPAATNPDKFAWDLFVQLVWPAVPGRRGVPDPTQRPGANVPSVWETWKAGSDIYLSPATLPAPWESPLALTPKGAAKKQFLPPKFSILKALGRGKLTREALDSGHKGIGADIPGQEVRVNKATFDYVMANRLWSIDGQEKFRATGKEVQFPVDSIAVKAAWNPLTPAQIQSGRYYMAEQDNVVYGLVGLHITSKALPMWFWCTFEQVDNPSPDIPDRDRFTAFLNPNATTPPLNRLRIVPPPLQGSVWQYYVLRGTQINYIDAMGVPTILGNTQLENGMQSTASCMGCHGRATIGDRMDNIMALGGTPVYPAGTFFYPGGFLYGDLTDGRGANRLTVDGEKTFWQQDPQNPNDATKVQLSNSANGAPSPALYYKASAGSLRYTQMDFMWEFIFSSREPAVQPGQSR